MADEESEFWRRVDDYRTRFTREDFRGTAVASALNLRREAQDMFADLADCATFASDTEDEQDYVRWLQRAEEDISNRVAQALGTAGTMDEAEAHLAFAYAILREIAADALSRRP